MWPYIRYHVDNLRQNPRPWEVFQLILIEYAFIECLPCDQHCDRYWETTKIHNEASLKGIYSTSGNWEHSQKIRDQYKYYHAVLHTITYCISHGNTEKRVTWESYDNPGEPMVIRKDEEWRHRWYCHEEDFQRQLLPWKYSVLLDSHSFTKQRLKCLHTEHQAPAHMHYVIFHL